MRPFLAAAVLLALAVPRAAQNPGFFPVSLEYSADSTATRTSIAGDLQAIRTAGFNSVATEVRWSESEPVRGKYVFESLERTLDAAGQSGLRAIVEIVNTPPSWIVARYADSERKLAGVPVTREVCFDHPGVRGDLMAFIAAVSRTASRHRALFAIDVGSPLPSGLCLCAHTTRRVQGLGAANPDPDAVLSRMLREDLEHMVRASGVIGVLSFSHAARPSVLRAVSASPPGQDDWQMAGAVDRYGTSVDSSSSLTGSTGPLRLMADAVAGATRRTGWWLDVEASVPEDTRRLAAWTAISRGARGLVFGDPPPELGFVRAIASNPALFSAVRPRPARIALVFDPQASGSRVAQIHQALDELHVAVDIVHVEELTTDVAGYRAIVGTSSRPLSRPAAAALDIYRSNGGVFIDAAASSSDVARVLDQVKSAGVAPEPRIDGGEGVEVRFLESETVQMIVGLNHSGQSRRVTMTFAPDTQEAIWQNLETGAGVNFIAGADGPVHTYWFRPKDALVLMIRKDIR